MNISKHKKKGGKKSKYKGDSGLLVVRRIDGLTSDLDKLTNLYGISNESQVVRLVIKEKANSI